jgi:hypothetical protein
MDIGAALLDNFDLVRATARRWRQGDLRPCGARKSGHLEQQEFGS